MNRRSGREKHSIRWCNPSAHNGLPDCWEFEYFGATGQNPNALAARGDGSTLLQCFQQGLNPNDFYNGISPTLTIMSGTNQTGAAGMLLTAPLVVQVTGSSGQPMTNAPVTFAVTQGTGSLAPDLSGTWAASNSFPVRTGTNGNVQIYFQQPMDAAFTSTVAVMAAKSEVDFSEFTLPDNNAPAAPANVSAVVQSDGTVLVTWHDNSDNETGFTIKQSNDGGQTWSTVGTAGADATSVTVAAGGNVTNGVSQFQATATGAAGNSSSSGTNNGTAFQPIPALNYAVIDMSGTIPIPDLSYLHVALDDNNHAAFMFEDIGNSCKSYTWQNGVASNSPATALILSGTTAYRINGLLPDGTIFGDQWNGTQQQDVNTSGGFSVLGSSLTFAGMPPPFTTTLIHGGINLYQVTGTSSFGFSLGVSYPNYSGELWFVKHGGAYAVFTLPATAQIIGGTQIVNMNVTPFLVNDNGWLVVGTTEDLLSHSNPAVWPGSGTNVISLAPMEQAWAINDIGQVIGADGYLWTSGSNNWSAAPFVQNGTSQPVSQLIPAAYQNEVSYISPFAISGTNANNSVGMLFGAQYQTDSKGDKASGTFLLTLTNGGTSSVMQQVVVPSNVNASLSILNSQGLIAGIGTITGTNGVASKQKALLFLPVELAVDSNRDGAIVLASDPNNPANVDASGNPLPVDTTSQDKSYRFWLNDDQDGGTPYTAHGGSDVVPPLAPDYKLQWIGNQRNLEDFARLWVHIGGFQDAITSGSIQVGFKWKTVSSGSPAIKIFLSADPNGSDSYLTGTDAAFTQVNGPCDYEIQDVNKKEQIDTSGTFILPTKLVTGPPAGTTTTILDWTGGTEHFLFEGASEGKGELELVFLDKSGNQIGEGGSLWLDLKNIKKMYVRAKGTPVDGIASPWTSKDPTPTDFADDSNGNAFDQPPDEEKNVIVFIHGIHPPGTENSGHLGNINVAETIFKRFWHAGYKGRFACYTWPALTPAGLPPPFGFNFNESEYRGWKYGRGLARFVASLPSGYGKHILAHSQGNAVVGAAFRSYGLNAITWMPTNGAIPISCYDSNLANYVFQYTTPDLWSSLGYRGYLEQHVNARVVNLYNPEDHITGWVWQTNQQLWKPDAGLGYAYYYDPVYDQVKVASNFGFSNRLVGDNHESMAMAVQSKSKAIGQEGVQVSGIVKRNLDINNEFNFGDSHGGQWDFDIQETLPYYKTIIDIIHGD